MRNENPHASCAVCTSFRTPFLMVFVMAMPSRSSRVGRALQEAVLLSCGIVRLGQLKSAGSQYSTFLVSRGWFRILFWLTSDRFDFVLGVQRSV